MLHVSVLHVRFLFSLFFSPQRSDSNAPVSILLCIFQTREREREREWEKEREKERENDLLSAGLLARCLTWSGLVQSEDKNYD